MDDMEKDLQEEIEDEDVEISDEDYSEEETPEEDSADGSEDDIDFEYDEDGNIVIPDDEETVEDVVSEADAETENTDSAPEDTEEQDVTKMDDKASPQDDELAKVRRELDAYKKQTKKTLQSYGIESEDGLKGLAQIAADSEGKDLEQYLAEREEERKAEEKKNADFEELAKSDLEALKRSYPELSSYRHITDMPRDVLVRFAENRRNGLDAKSAYAAANPDGIRESAALAARKSVNAESKNHLKSRVPKGSAPASTTIPPSELKAWMDDFPNLSKKEVVELYKKTR